MRTSFYLTIGTVLITCLSSCSKEQFAANKAPQSSTINPLDTTSSLLCSQSTLVSPQVDLLLLWDNSSSALFINSATKSSFNQLITSVSEKFDYHILSAPLVSTNSNSLYEATLVTKNIASVSGNALGIIKTKDQAAASLGFSQASGSVELGVDRATSIIEANKANGIFRTNAYTVIVVMSNGDDTSCELATGYSSCAPGDINGRLQSKIDKLLCLRGHTSGIDCSATTSLDSTMMRFINIAPLTSCTSGLGKINTRYRNIAKAIYETPYTKYPLESSAWPTSNDNLNPFISGGIKYPDNYDICAIDFNHIFDGVNSAIKQTLIKHVYSYWPVTGANTSLDPATLRVSRDDGKVLVNRTGQTGPADGYAYIGNQLNHFTRNYPTQGENFSGQMIELFGVNNNDLVVYPHCLTVTFDAQKLQYGYIYLKHGKPYIPTIVVHINGALVPQDATNGWDYLGQQSTSTLDQNLKVVDLPDGTTSGYLLKLNGSYKFNNTSGSAIIVDVAYTSKVN